MRRLGETSDTDPALEGLLLKLHKGSVAGFNAKTTTQVLGLFPGWTITPAVFLKPSDESRSLHINITLDLYSHLTNKVEPRRFSMLAVAMRDPKTGKSIPRLQARAYSKDEADGQCAELAKYVVTALPEPKKAKPDDYFVMNLTDPVETEDEDRHGHVWVWSFDLYRKCKGYHIVAPDGQAFDVCGPVQVLGYTGTKDFAAFFTWAFANTDLEELVNAKLGVAKHVKAADRPRIAVGGQTIGACAICARDQVVRNGRMVNHGYQRPGYGYIIGECFGVGYPAYETSAAACVAYVPHLEAGKSDYEQRLANLQSGKVTQFTETQRNWRTRRDEKIVIKQGEPRFAGLLKSHIKNTEQQIKYITADIATMQRKITDWTPGTLRHNQPIA